jgi:TPR repeat protein
MLPRPGWVAFLVASCALVTFALPLPRKASGATTGVDIVRLPSAEHPARKTAQPTAEPVGRMLKIRLRLGSNPTDVAKGFIGVVMEGLEPTLAVSLGLRTADGALVFETTPGSPAAQHGIRRGDIILGLNGKPVANMNDVVGGVASTPPGTEVILELWRVTADDGDFLQTLRLIAERGNAHIMLRLGNMYAAARGVARDDAEAVSWYRKAAAAGNSDAAAALANMLLEGLGAEQNPQEAVRLLRVAANSNNRDAAHRLGVLLYEGKVVAKDFLEAARWFTKAGEAGHVHSMRYLGYMYANGEGLQIDFVKDAMWYKPAADSGDVIAMANLGLMLEKGQGVARDDWAAASLYRKAANAGNSYAMYDFARMLDQGRGVERADPELAAEMMLRAIALGHQLSFAQIAQHPHNWSVQLRKALQRKLRAAGFYSAKIDGEIGGPTIAALSAYRTHRR